MDAAGLLPLAERLADAARPHLLRHFRAAVAIDDKADASPVTIADRDAETAMRAILAVEAPDHGVLGEEHGAEGLDREWVWVLDPIDGTKSFVTGKPLFGTLVGLAWRGRPALGVVDMPALGERWVGGEGVPARWTGRDGAGGLARTRTCGALGEAWAYATSPAMFAGDPDRAAAWDRLGGAVKHALWGADCYGYMMLAAGWCDLVCEADVKPYDLFAPAAIVAAAGGVAVGWDGAPLTLDAATRVLCVGDRALLGPALERLQG